MHKNKLRLYIKSSELIYLTLYDLHDGVSNILLLYDIIILRYACFCARSYENVAWCVT